VTETSPHNSLVSPSGMDETLEVTRVHPREFFAVEKMERTWERRPLLACTGMDKAGSLQDVGGKEKRLSEMSGEEKVLWACFFVLGAGTLAGWNSLCAAVDFFRAHFEGRDAPVWLSLTFEVATMTSLGLLALGADKVAKAVP